MTAGSLMRPGRSLGPSASGPMSGPTKCQPRSASVFTLARVAGWAYIASFMAGAASTGPGRTSSNGGRDRKSTRLNSSHLLNSYAGFFFKKKKKKEQDKQHKEKKQMLD